MDDLFGVTELIQQKAVDAEHGIVATDADKTARSHVEDVNPAARV